MRIGFHVPQWGPGATREGVVAVARAVEAAGLDSVWVADHLVYPLGRQTQYPYQESTPFRPQDGFLEAFTVLSVVAGATSRVRIGTSILVLPMRDLLVTAKVACTLDVLSGGRLVLGVGAGWWEEEFAALKQPFRRRGDRLDEQVRVLRRLWAEGTVGYDGEWYSFPELACEPKPLQPGGPPLLIGGMNSRALQRAGALGDGWHATGVHPETLTNGFAKVRESALKAGREPDVLTLSTSTVLPVDEDAQARRLERLQAAGLHEVVFKVQSDDVEEICATIGKFAERVVPRAVHRT